MYGLQGMENHSPEVKQLVAAIGVKLSAADEVLYRTAHCTTLICALTLLVSSVNRILTVTLILRLILTHSALTDLTDLLMFFLPLG